MICDTCRNAKLSYSSKSGKVDKDYYVVGCRKHGQITEDEYIGLLAETLDSCSRYSKNKTK